MLTSTRDDYQVRGQARHSYKCSGAARLTGEHSPMCLRRIAEGTEYVARVQRVEACRTTPRRFEDVSRHCIHCALSFIPQIVVTGAVN